MWAIGLECLALIIRGSICSFANIFFISAALSSSGFVHHAKATKCKSPSLALGSHTFMFVKAMLCK